MRKLVNTVLSLQVFGGVVFAQSPSNTQNHVQKITVSAGHKTVGSLSGLPADSANRSVQYLNGLDLPLQAV